MAEEALFRHSVCVCLFLWRKVDVEVKSEVLKSSLSGTSVGLELRCPLRRSPAINPPRRWINTKYIDTIVHCRARVKLSLIPTLLPLKASTAPLQKTTESPPHTRVTEQTPFHSKQRLRATKRVTHTPRYHGSACSVGGP